MTKGCLKKEIDDGPKGILGISNRLIVGLALNTGRKGMTARIVQYKQT